jgi:hypothetical protein
MYGAKSRHMKEKVISSFRPFDSRNESHSHRTACSRRSSVLQSRGWGSKARRLAGTASVTLWQPIFGQQVLTSRRRGNFCAMRTHGSRSMFTHERSPRPRARQQPAHGDGTRGGKGRRFQQPLQHPRRVRRGGSEKGADRSSTLKRGS